LTCLAGASALRSATQPRPIEAFAQVNSTVALVFAQLDSHKSGIILDIVPTHAVNSCWMLDRGGVNKGNGFDQRMRDSNHARAFLKNDVMVSAKQMFPTGIRCFLCDNYFHERTIPLIPKPIIYQDESLLVRQLAGTCFRPNSAVSHLTNTMRNRVTSASRTTLDAQWTQSTFLLSA
jgi:hypothetical protein